MNIQKPKARIKITLDCDRQCKYCINHSAAYRSKWQEIESVFDTDWSGYRTIIISGGEPTTDMRLKYIVKSLRDVTDGLIPIYLQTNGWGLTKELVREIDGDIDGIGLSIHDVAEFGHMLTRWSDIVRIKPIRLYVQDVLHQSAMTVSGSMEPMFTWRVWKDGDFDSNEEIFLLTGWQTRPILKECK